MATGLNDGTTGLSQGVALEWIAGLYGGPWLDNTTSVSSAPVNAILPVITGLTVSGDVLSVSHGAWSNIPTSFAYQWTADGSNIAAATHQTFTLTDTQIGAMIACVVTATNAIGSTPATSASVGPVTGA